MKGLLCAGITSMLPALPCEEGRHSPGKQGVGNLHSLLLSTDFPLLLPNASHLSTFLRAGPLRIPSVCGVIFADSQDCDTPSFGHKAEFIEVYGSIVNISRTLETNRFI